MGSNFITKKYFFHEISAEEPFSGFSTFSNTVLLLPKLQARFVADVDDNEELF